MTPNLDLFELITYENIHELQPGEWIWDNKQQARRVHKRSIYNESIVEPIGFRIVNIIDLDGFYRFHSKPFMPSSIDNIGFGSGMTWEYFELNRFYKFKKENKNDQT